MTGWEQEALERIAPRLRYARGLDRHVGEILRERSQRSVESPLLFHDALVLRSSGQTEAARKLLRSAVLVDGPIGRDRGVLRALLELEVGDRRAADAPIRRDRATKPLERS